MARPKTKDQLLKEAASQYEKLMSLIGSMTLEVQESGFLFEDRDRNVRDVLMHLHEWHQMMSKWYTEGVVNKGLPKTPSEDFNWRQLPELNKRIWEKHQAVSLEESKQLLDESHHLMVDLIEKHTDKELFDKFVYPWTKTSTLGTYFVANTSSHYIWAQKKVRRHIKTLEG